MIIGVGEKRNRKCLKNFATHNGIFHCDEVVGIAILLIANSSRACYVVRTRDIDELSKIGIVIDVGGGKFDHHMAGFNRCRPTGEKYASAGLVWEAYAKDAIRSVMLDVDYALEDDEIEAIKEMIDREFIIPVDLEDNGIKASEHRFSFITSYLPAWNAEQDFNAAFMEVVQIVVSILEKAIKDKIMQFASKHELEKRCKLVVDGICEIPAQTVQWLEFVVKYNASHNNEIKFVIYPYPDGGWAAQCVPPSLEKKFEQLVPFPEEWAGGNQYTLPQISGISGAILCHNDRFFARAINQEVITKMCKVAMSQK